ncbi:hypothetical protein M758_UG318400 [Ceratodon purpureus]|nr:hypothetical protein M758_UG318400 [Ceratodon purpureus]
MRQKWLCCWCGPNHGTFSDESYCKCILELPTQEARVDTPVSSCSLPSEFDGSEDDTNDCPIQFLSPCTRDKGHELRTIDEEGMRLLSTEVSSGRTEILETEGFTDPLPTDSAEAICLGRNSNYIFKNDIEDTASSACQPFKRRRLSCRQA